VEIIQNHCSIKFGRMIADKYEVEPARFEQLTCFNLVPRDGGIELSVLEHALQRDERIRIDVENQNSWPPRVHCFSPWLTRGRNPRQIMLPGTSQKRRGTDSGVGLKHEYCVGLILSVTGITVVCPIPHKSGNMRRGSAVSGQAGKSPFYYAVTFAGALLQLLPVKNVNLAVPNANDSGLPQPAYRRRD